MFKGSIVALITPFNNDKLNEENYVKLIHHHLENGTNGVVPAGTTGESPTLSHSEHNKVIELAIKECKGKIPVIAGTGSNSTSKQSNFPYMQKNQSRWFAHCDSILQ